MTIGKLILNDGTELEVLEDSSEFAISAECSSFAEIEEISKKLTIQNLKRFGLSFAEGFIDYKTYKNVSGINISPINENGKYKALFMLADDNFVEIQMLEMQDYQMLNNSTVLATQILAQKLSDAEALTVKEIYPKWTDKTDYEIGYKVLFGEVLYKCLDEHTSTNKNRPGADETIWKNIDGNSDNTEPNVPAPEPDAGTTEEPVKTPTEEFPDPNVGNESGSDIIDGEQTTK